MQQDEYSIEQRVAAHHAAFLAQINDIFAGALKAQVRREIVRAEDAGEIAKVEEYTDTHSYDDAYAEEMRDARRQEWNDWLKGGIL